MFEFSKNVQQPLRQVVYNVFGTNFNIPLPCGESNHTKVLKCLIILCTPFYFLKELFYFKGSSTKRGFCPIFLISQCLPSDLMFWFDFILSICTNFKICIVERFFGHFNVRSKLFIPLQLCEP